MTEVFLVYMDKLFCSDINIDSDGNIDIDINSNQVSIGEKYVD